ncbi:hypothetical protein [Haloferula sp. BvORR071]|uniref:hypothetical protein n=1 Tax=Haloferula sp. BvORR071 TaxID=1396141 RepID=UPI002240F02A|nr:hypothetical protein [Haloferula sp. BvORR071]
MKAVIFLLLAGALQATEIEGTVWYNSEGKVAVVDGPATEKRAPHTWQPQWFAREARRDKALRGEFRHRSSRRTYGDGYDDYGYGWGYSYAPYFSTGIGYRCAPRPCVSYASPSAGLRVIIR